MVKGFASEGLGSSGLKWEIDVVVDAFDFWQTYPSHVRLRRQYI